MSESKRTVLARLQELREALSQERISDTVTQARHQCDRLEQGLALSHPEGVRFAAHTLLKLLDSSAASSAAVTAAHAGLKTALEDAGLPH